MLSPQQGGRYGYGVRFLIRETGGRSGATIEEVTAHGLFGSEPTGPSCWGPPLRVAPLGSLDTLYTEEGYRWLSYCAPGALGFTATPALHVVLRFKDDEGIDGAIDFPVTAIR